MFYIKRPESYTLKNKRIINILPEITHFLYNIMKKEVLQRLRLLFTEVVTLTQRVIGLF